MFAKAILFMLAASWFYIAFVLARLDRRWFAGRIVQSIVMGAVPAVCFWRNWASSDVLILVGLAFVLFGMYPAALERKALDAITRGRPGRRRVQLLLLHLLTWDRTSRALRALQRAVEGARGPSPALPSAVQDELAAAFVGKSGPRVRSRYLAPLMLLLFRLRRWRDAADVFEQVFADEGEQAGSELLLLMVRPYAELGRSDKAFELLTAALSHPSIGDYRSEEVLACVAVLALNGKREAVAQVLDRRRDTLASLPASLGPYWEGVADLAAGDEAGAREKFARALELAAQGERPAESPMWQTATTGRLLDAAALHERALAAPLSEEQVEGLLALERRALEEAALRPVGAKLFARGIGRLTAALIGVNVAVWLLMTLTSSTTDMNALITFGANVPVLVTKDHQYWRLISSMFIHIGILHLAFNAYAFYLFGTLLERWCGSRQMFLIYMVSGLCGSAASGFLGRYNASAGASGAIMGLLGAAIVVIFRFRSAFPAAARKLYAMNFILMAVLTLSFGLLQEGIDNYAHTGGLFAGALVGFFLPSCPREGPEQGSRRRLRAYLSNAAVAVFAALLLWTAALAARNVLAGGYPRVLPRMEERVSREQQVAITVPAFWQVRDGEGQDSLLLADPVGGGVLRLRVEPVNPGEDLEKALEQAAQRRWLETVTPSPHSRARGALAPPSPLDLGGRPVYNFSYVVHVPLKGLEDREINAMVDIYVTSPEWPRFTRRSLGEGGASARGARLCWLEFQVPEASFKAYLPLIRKIVGSVRSTRLSDSGPGQWVLEKGVIGKKGQTPILVRHGLVGA